MENNIQKTDTGFGKHAEFALDLMKKTIDLLNENNIDYYLISGTLLGHVRHHEFIPWDDDIDLIVSEDILDKLPNLAKNTELTFMKINDGVLKTCLKTGVKKITHVHADKVINKEDSYFWPFVDLFIYKKTDTHLKFFHKNWEITKFEPATLDTFLNIPVKVPNNPDYFLTINYGADYLTNFKQSTYDHSNECPIRTNPVVKINRLPSKKPDKKNTFKITQLLFRK